MRLSGQVAIVTGAAQGLGAAFARALRAEGCAVTLTDRDHTVRSVAAEVDGVAHVGDVADAAHVRAVVDAVTGAHGRIDVLISNAGEVWPTGPLDTWERALEDYDRLVGSNLRGAYLFGRAVAPVMVAGGGGNIVNVSTDHVKPAPGSRRHHGHGGMDLYNAAKWALNGLTFDWAKALARHGVRVNNVCMGATDTGMLRRWIGSEPDPAYLATWMRPEAVAEVVVQVLAEGPDGRTGDSIGLYAGFPTVLPDPEA
jgi:NAD(P)-dependent dehydrogenase (short-subunit alcohol dehydrogenase family)